MAFQASPLERLALAVVEDRHHFRLQLHARIIIGQLVQPILELG
jgi:hypothetical protein